MKATALLKKDHALVKALFRRFMQSTPRAIKTRERLIAQIRSELEIHAQIEEEIFYPAVRRLERGQQLIAEAELEHEKVKRILAEIAGIAITAPALQDRVQALKSAVLAHATEEEKEVFAVAAQLGNDELERLGAQMAERKDALHQGVPLSLKVPIVWPALALGFATGLILAMRPGARRAA
jgi:hemerythrin superfamily protein